MKEHPEWGVSEYGKALGKMWKSVDSSEKAQFEEKYQKAKATYVNKLEKYKR